MSLRDIIFDKKIIKFLGSLQYKYKEYLSMKNSTHEQSYRVEKISLDHLLEKA